MDRQRIEIDKTVNILDLNLNSYNDSTNLFIRNTTEENITVRKVTVLEILKTIQELKDEISYLKTKNT
jgi:hypothetical protein